MAYAIITRIGEFDSGCCVMTIDTTRYKVSLGGNFTQRALAREWKIKG